MKNLLSTLGLMLLMFQAAPLIAGDPVLSPVAKTLDKEVGIIEGEFVSLAEEITADKYSFAPTAGEFKGVRTFGQQVSHTAANVYSASAAVLGEKLSPEFGDGDNAPATVKTKEDIVKFLKAAFVYAHKAVAGVTAANVADSVSAVWGKDTRLFMANLVVWHSFDHYGQAVVYARMNGIIPPASRPKK